MKTHDDRSTVEASVRGVQPPAQLELCLVIAGSREEPERVGEVAFLGPGTHVLGAFKVDLPVTQSHSGSSPNPINIHRSSTGNYTLTLPPLDNLTSISAHVVATGATNSSCSLPYLTQSTARVVCTANGAPSDSAFAFQLY